MKPFLKNTLIVVTAAAVTFSVTTLIYAINGVNFRVADSTAADGMFGMNFSSMDMSSKDGVDVKLDAINTYLEREFLYDDYVQKDMNEAAVKAYVEAIDEPYTHYYTKEEFESYIGGVEESYVGIGIVISVDEEAEKIIIVAPTEDSPAYKAGLLPGDYITAVNGVHYSGDEMDECVAAIKGGAQGTKVTVTIERDGVETDYEIVRASISANSVKSEMLNDEIGYLRISSFNTHDENSEESTFTEFKTNIEILKNKGMKKLVIDLRDNPGGVLDVVCDISDYLLPEGIITYTETKTGNRTNYRSDANELNIPIVVLINGNSASAAEILTGALKDFDRAEVVGETSFGKGIVQSVLPFADGSGMSLTTAKYYTPSGVCIHGVGIEPDYVVETPEKYKNGYASMIPRDEDVQLNKALELLEEK